MRRLVVVLVVLAVLFVAADRFAVRIADHRLAAQAEDRAGASAGTASIGGFPFLTQVASGTYRDVTLHLSDVQRTSGSTKVRLSRLTAQLHGVRVPLSTLLDGTVESVPVDRVTGTALIRYPDLTTAVGHGISYDDDGGKLRARGKITLLGQTLAGAALVTPTVRDGRLALSASDVQGQAGPLAGTLSTALVGALSFTLPVDLPFGLVFSAVRVTPQGLVVSAAGRNVNLQS